MIYAVLEDLAYVVNHAIEHPLDVHLDPAPQSKPIHAFMDFNVRKHRLNNGYTLRIDPAPLFAIDLRDHSLGQIARNTTQRDHEIPAIRSLAFDASGL